MEGAGLVDRNEPQRLQADAEQALVRMADGGAATVSILAGNLGKSISYTEAIIDDLTDAGYAGVVVHYTGGDAKFEVTKEGRRYLRILLLA